MAPIADHELSIAIRNADPPAWSIRGATGRQLAMEERADVIHHLLLDTQDTWVIQETAEALLARKDTIGLRYVLLACSRADTNDAADQLGAALACNPQWMTPEGAD